VIDVPKELGRAGEAVDALAKTIDGDPRAAVRGGGAVRGARATPYAWRASRSTTDRADRGVFMISVAAELAEMHPQTLRMYEARGLIEPKRSPKGTRLYSQDDVEQLRRIQEMTAELGLNLAGGASSACEDVTHETGAPGIEVNEIGIHRFGDGPVIERGSTLNPALFERLYETAEREKIPFTIAAVARSSGTDADAIHRSRAGIPAGLISIPLRYMHSPVEMAQLDDIDACARLIAAFAQSLSADTSFAR
jgi:hypothetical protein